MSANGRSTYWLVRGLRTHARVFGRGAPLVIVPGLGCASWMYSRLARELAPDRQVYCYDPPAHGLSEGLTNYPVRIRQLTEHLAEWLEVAGLRGVPIIGHSLGGEVLFDLSVCWPELVSALIACAPTGVPDNPHVTIQLWHLLKDLPLERPQLLPLGMAAYQRVGPWRMLRLAKSQDKHHTSQILPQVTQPTLLLTCAADPVIHPWTVEEIRCAIADSTIQIIPDGTHAITDSYPRVIAHSTLEFLRAVEK